jgi:hypothetical protein
MQQQILGLERLAKMVADLLRQCREYEETAMVDTLLMMSQMKSEMTLE